MFLPQQLKLRSRAISLCLPVFFLPFPRNSYNRIHHNLNLAISSIFRQDSYYHHLSAFSKHYSPMNERYPCSQFHKIILTYLVLEECILLKLTFLGFSRRLRGLFYLKFLSLIQLRIRQASYMLDFLDLINYSSF